jgi:hypothetical protein
MEHVLHTAFLLTCAFCVEFRAFFEKFLALTPVLHIFTAASGTAVNGAGD